MVRRRLGDQQINRVGDEQCEKRHEYQRDELLDPRELQVGLASFRMTQNIPFFAITCEWELLFYLANYLVLGAIQIAV